MLSLSEVLSDFNLAAGCDGGVNAVVNAVGRFGQTPLHFVATLGDIAAIRLLIGAGAVVDARDDNGNTPIHEAVLCRQTAAAYELSKFSDLTIRNNSGLTAEDLAVADNFKPMSELFKPGSSRE